MRCRERSRALGSTCSEGVTRARARGLDGVARCAITVEGGDTSTKWRGASPCAHGARRLEGEGIACGGWNEGLAVAGVCFCPAEVTGG